MTISDDVGRLGLGRGPNRSPLGFGLNLVGVAVIGYFLVVNGARSGYPSWVFVVAGVALAAWIVREVTSRHRVLVVAAGVMVVAGALTACPTDAVLLTPVIVGVVALQADRSLPIWLGVVAAIVGTVLVAGGAAATGQSVAFVLGSLAGLLLGVLIGVSRRQFRDAEDRRREMQAEQQRAELLADRARAARDIHDVLAHSLGGLVIQLDAVEALLEAGRAGDAATRAADARALAADGLAEARRAVAALRDPEDRPLPPASQEADAGSEAEHRAAAAPARADHAGLAALVDAHRSFGGDIAVHGDLTLSALDDRHAAAAAAAVREALSNARRHAPGAAVALSVVRDGAAVRIVVTNPLPPGGHGLVGMRERFAELGDGSNVVAERSEREFRVAMRLPAAPDAPQQDEEPA